jgi:general nucleoside transport system permease protein
LEGAAMIDNILHSAVLMTTPILLAAMGGLLNRVGGLVNIGLESMMLAGALASLIVSAKTGSWVLASGAAAGVGACIGLLMSLMVTRLRANEIVVGLGFNVLVASLVRFALKSIWRTSGTLNLPDVVMLPHVVIPGVDRAPVLGAIFSGQDPLSWLAWLSVPSIAWGLARTRAGLRLRATGAAEPVLHALGLRPLAIRDYSSVVAGLFAGLGGAQLAIGVVGLFNEGLVAGRGFIALAAFYFGRNRPWPTAAATLLFGLFDAIQIRLQGEGLPSELVQMLPYVVVILALLLAAAARKGRAERFV